MAKIILNALQTRGHVTTKREKLLGLMAFADPLADNDLEYSLHRLVLVTVKLDLAINQESLDLLSEGTLVVFW